ncbi:uncharacterized protein MELLADRAFT_115844 [Melampsora larici-populina 98AG31]|uniref:Glycosyl transferase family 25 domain-containing protein n=1 Tax=Melampsora larici-populina (strain 98AG31 / pathotype 3-4-7) TaxID=747676 RepID=F4REU7_MELLP|nr:uncharacterized protein MELLADRAFT_115844 [Melampsora larici-populina 98AG31]EGG09221.1 hypothetical protein MELLADRAFT_115844 [Melampsora larici-populina 98AG31]
MFSSFKPNDNHSYKSLSPWAFTISTILITIILITRTFISNFSIPITSTSSSSSSPSPSFFNTNLFQNALKSNPQPIHSNVNTLNQLTDQLPFFSSIRVVSLKSRTDRRNHMKKLNSFLDLKIKFSDAILYNDSRVNEIVNRVGNQTKADKKMAEVGHVACRMSHRMAIQAAEDDHDEFTLILEDDVDIESAFKYLSGTILRDVPKDWDMIFFGHTDFSDESRHGRDPRTSNFYIYKSIEPQGGHGYALSPKGRKLILDLLSNKRPELYETDEGQPIDEIFMYLARLHKANLFSIIPDLIIQKSLFKSDIFNTSAGFKDGMHDKVLLDSALDRIRLLDNRLNLTTLHP